MFSESYCKARKKAKKAEYTSELNSKTDNSKRDGIKEKVKKVKKYDSSEESISDENEFTKLLIPPLMQRKFQ